MATASRRLAYRSYRSDGSVASGLIEASGEAEAARLLRQRGEQPFDLRPAAAGRGPEAGRRPKADLVRFFEDLSVMLSTGFTVDVALRAMAEGETDRRQAACIRGVLAGLSEGAPIAGAVEAAMEVGPDVVALLDSGESSGRLDLVVADLARTTARRRARLRELRDALSYPAFLVCVMCLALALLSLYLAPALRPIFDNAGMPPPRPLLLLDAFGTGLRRFGPALLIAAPLAGLALALAARRPATRDRLLDAWARMPLAGPTVRLASSSRYLGTLSLLVSSGVPLLTAMELSERTIPGRAQRIALEGARRRASEGEAVWRALEASAQVPGHIVSLIRLGEQSNRLGHMLGRASEILDARIERKLKQFAAVLTPAITILLGVLVGTLVVSVMTTLLGINELAL